MIMIKTMTTNMMLLLLPFVLQSAVAFTVSPSIATTSTINNDRSQSTSTQLHLERRDLLTSAALLTAGSLIAISDPPPAKAEEPPTKYTLYKNENCGFQINVPSTWEKVVQQMPDRNEITLFLDPTSDRKTLLSMAFTPIRDDFTSLSSFGSVDQVAQAVILPGGEISGQKIESKMISAESKKSAYIFDYTSKPPQIEDQHYRTIFALAVGATGGAGSILVSITAQTPESNYANLKSVFDDIEESYKKI
mmetsp:Transcript_28450/g.40253  ORF Transcript_28450/g.40253 Transcript_28450/m.40253 type:complete len:249 (-) Transcript_28450:103-849(-)|eukprot:CAMPEP_0202473220 /NCGR_PEP_ID=MMETSP1360-20130828/90342_1 /ASSEMBLY_ACC=CAM_ASM_000848 /TAXON_ID=515479 /ORGANISM="Licmophora paradoxa, Strain CCMP2313" /LENGTH=248 /DNA_ID=CAMNT_0049100035 /DNA_START=49 /DNA_END=795 /DNA_ORIENTATION=-